MNSANQSGDINYYEELGVEPNATPEEIREAYRALVRMLHPDSQLDEQMKLVADRQLRKLNAVYKVLSDPEQRRNYDEDRSEGFGHPIIVNAPPVERSRAHVARPVVWVSAILLVTGLLFWLASPNVSAPQFRARESASSNAATDSPGAAPAAISGKTNDATVRRLRSDLSLVASQRDAAERELAELRASLSKPERKPYQPPPATKNVPSQHADTALAGVIPEPPRPPSGVPATTTARLALPTPAAPAPRPDAASRPKRLAGFWFYVKPENSGTAKTRGDYAPEFIEATITEDNGVVRGNYRSRFRIVDRPISPDVNFTFTGAPIGTVLKCPWTGPGGARGEITVQLVSENSIRLDWVASELGTQQGLLSGTAVLTRKVD